MSVNVDSYCALMLRVRALDGSVLTSAQAQQIRDAADARLFGDEDHMEIATGVLDLLDSLVAAARLSSRTSGALSEMLCDIESVGTAS